MARQHRVAERAVARENRAAAGLAVDDARAILAARVAESLEGGQAAVLRPIARKNLVALGATLGLRPFDTSLVIAIVQDRARAGGPGDGAQDGRISIVASPAAPATGTRIERRTMLLTLGAAVALAGAFFAALVRWVTRG